MNRKLYKIHLEKQRIKNSAAKEERRRRRKKSLNKSIDPCVKHPNRFYELPIPRRYRRNYTPNGLSQSSYTKSKKTEYINRYLPSNLKYILKCEHSPFLLSKIKKGGYITNGTILIPDDFSILNNAKASYETLCKIIFALLIEDNKTVTLDYSRCTHVSLSTQMLLDIILMDFVNFRNKCNNMFGGKKSLYPTIQGREIRGESLQKMMFSVGSPANLNIKHLRFDDVIKYALNVHDNYNCKDEIKRMEQKEIDTTEMVDYVNACLSRMNKKLTPKKLDDLCTVIGEILINAEEHSSTKYRFSMGYFIEKKENGSHYGLFRLAIMNFGQTIYDKFKSPDCPNKEIVNKMKELSSKYTKKRFFRPGKFEEESLWTLYALQEGVTSVSTGTQKRGNGSIRFLESFFNIKGSTDVDNVSVMTILSGKTKILFNGEYGITIKDGGNGEKFRMMTFNKSGNIDEMPDNQYVQHTDFYFPGTLITANILLNDDDIKQLEVC